MPEPKTVAFLVFLLSISLAILIFSVQGSLLDKYRDAVKKMPTGKSEEKEDEG